LGNELTKPCHNFFRLRHAPGQCMARSQNAHGAWQVRLAPQGILRPKSCIVVATGTEVGEPRIELPCVSPRIERAQAHRHSYVLESSFETSQTDLHPAAEAPGGRQVCVQG